MDADASPQEVGRDAATDESPEDVGRDAMADLTVLPTGRRSFVVTSTLTPQPGGMGFVPLPAMHTFTMVLDWDGRTAIIGSTDGAGAGGFQPSAGGGSIGQIGSFRFGTASMGYQSIALTIDAAGKLSGTGQGMATALPAYTDVGIYTVNLSAALVGVPDVQPPGFDSTAFGPAPLDAFASLTIVATEPMPIDTRLALVNRRGDRIELGPLATQGGAAFSFQPSPFKMWRYGEQYSIAFDGLVDFAGNAYPPGGGVTLTIASAPPLVAEDGFESATGSTLAGAQLLTGTGAPIITGTRSLYVPPLPDVLTAGRVQMTQFALRIAVAPGDTVLRFSYREVNPNSFPGSFFLMGSEGGQVVSPSLPPTQSTTTATISGTGTVQLGPITTAEFALPPDAAGEVTLTRIVRGAGTSMPAPPVTGLIIDDLRAE